MAPAQRRDLPLKVLKGAEPPVDRCEPQVPHLVQFPQRLQGGQAYIMAGQDRPPRRAHRLLHVLPEQGQGVLADRPPLAGLADARDDLLPAERLGRAASLAHQQRGGLHRGKPATALGAGATSADHRAILGGPAVEHPAIVMPTERTMHTDHLISGGPPGGRVAWPSHCQRRPIRSRHPSRSSYTSVVYLDVAKLSAWYRSAQHDTRCRSN